MKKGIYAIYKGKEYSADFIDEKIVLRAYDINDLNNGFQKYDGYNKKIIGIKYVTKDEVQEIYDRRVTAVYKGYNFEVIEETDDMISIVTMVGDYQEWLRLGMKCIDKGVYQKWINKDDAEIIIKKESLL